MKCIRVPLRISFAGGGSDIPAHYNEHGGAVLSATINKYIYITAKRNVSLFPHRYRLVYSQVEQCNDRTEIKHPIIRSLVDQYSVAALDLDVMSDVPSGTGLGSSSAFTVGLHRALSQQPDKHVLAWMACRTELDELKEPIGKQDQYAAAFGGINYITFQAGRTKVQPLALPPSDVDRLSRSLHLIKVGGSRSASQILAEQDSARHISAINAMADLAHDANLCLRHGEINALGPIIDEGWQLKKNVNPNVTNPTVDWIISEAMKHGATGGKLLGAGGAGFVLLFCPHEDGKRMRYGMRDMGLTWVPFRLDFDGVKVLYEG